MRSALCAFVVSALTVMAVPAQGTVMTYFTTSDLTEKSSEVVQGKVQQQQSVMAGGHLWTDTYIRVTETLKGKARPGQTLIVRQLGGETLTLGMRASGSATFVRGEEVLVFLRPVKNHHVVVGMCLGKFSLRRDAAGQGMAYRDFSGAVFAHFDSRGKFQFHPNLPRITEDKMPLKRLLSDVRAQVRRGGVR